MHNRINIQISLDILLKGIRDAYSYIFKVKITFEG